MRRTLSIIAMATVVVASSMSLVPTRSAASETGMASIHQWRKVGRKTCMADHSHNGSGSGGTRAQAERSAIAHWADFTSLEYGSSWASFGNAIGKQMSCNGGSGWSCSLDATPCRPW